MTEQYRQAELANAKAELARARDQWNAAKTRKQRLDADEAMQFWGNKVAFLTFVPVK